MDVISAQALSALGDHLKDLWATLDTASAQLRSLERVIERLQALALEDIAPSPPPASIPPLRLVQPRRRAPNGYWQRIMLEILQQHGGSMSYGEVIHACESRGLAPNKRSCLVLLSHLVQDGLVRVEGPRQARRYAFKVDATPHRGVEQGSV
jgi:uncharacterized coiled-coil protein SlyX